MSQPMESIPVNPDEPTPTEPQDTVPFVEQVKKYLVAGVQNEATTIYMFPGAGITYRVGSRLMKVPDTNLTSDQTLAVAATIMPDNILEDPSPEAKHRYLERIKSVDFSYSITGIARFRVHLFRQRGSLAICIRVIPREIPDLKRYSLPDDFYMAVKDLKGGLFVVYGKGRSGKSFLMASIIDYINKSQSRMILILEPTIQVSHKNHYSLITQREIGIDMASLKQGLTDAQHQDQDVIVLDELNDEETFERVMESVLRGITVFAIAPTPDAEKTIQHLLHFRPPNRVMEQIGDLMTHLKGLLGTETMALPNGKREVRAKFVNASMINGLLLSKRTELEQKLSQRSVLEEIGTSSSVDQSWFEND